MRRRDLIKIDPTLLSGLQLTSTTLDKLLMTFSWHQDISYLKQISIC